MSIPIIILTGYGGLSRDIPSRGQSSARACEGTVLTEGWYIPGKPDKAVSVIFIDRPGQYTQTLEMIMFNKIKHLYCRQCYMTSMQVPGFISLCS